MKGRVLLGGPSTAVVASGPQAGLNPAYDYVLAMAVNANDPIDVMMAAYSLMFNEAKREIDESGGKVNGATGKLLAAAALANRVANFKHGRVLSVQLKEDNPHENAVRLLSDKLRENAIDADFSDVETNGVSSLTGADK